MKSRDDFVGIPGIINDIRIHFVIRNAPGPEGSGVGRGVGLSDDVVEKDVAVGVDGGGNEIIFERGRPKDGGRGDVDGSGIEGSVVRGRRGAVGGVVNCRVRRGRGNVDVKRGVVVATIDVESGVSNIVLLRNAGVFGTRGG